MIKACLKLYPKGNETVELLWLKINGKPRRKDFYDLILNLTEKTVIKNNLVPLTGPDQNNYLTLSNYLKINFPNVNFSYYENNTKVTESEFEYIDSSFPLIRTV